MQDLTFGDIRDLVEQCIDSWDTLDFATVQPKVDLLNHAQLELALWVAVAIHKETADLYQIVTRT